MIRLLLLTLVAILFANVFGTNIAFSQFDDFPGFDPGSFGDEGFGSIRQQQNLPITLTPLSLEEESQRASMVKILDRPVSLSEREWNLEELLESIERQLFIEIVPDMPALRDIGIDPELEPIDIPPNCELPARTVLEYVLPGLGLAWAVEGGLFIVTTTERVESLQIAKKYDVTDLVASEENGEPFEGREMIDLIMETVDPESWDTWGGPGRIEATGMNDRASITVQQSRYVLEDIEALLAQLRRLNVPQSERPHPPWVAEDALLLRRLKTQMVVGYPGNPLDHVVEDVCENTGAPVFLHVGALRELGIDPEIEPITYCARAMSVGDALDAILSDLGLTYAWREGVLWITTYEAMGDRRYMEPRVYDVSNLLVDNGDFGPLIDLIQETIEPESWDSWGGPGTLSEAELEHNYFLVIRQTWKTHRLIEQFLSELEMVSFGETVEDDPRWVSIVSQVESEQARGTRIIDERRSERASRPPAVQPQPEPRTDPFSQPSEGSAKPFGPADSGGADPFALAP